MNHYLSKYIICLLLTLLLIIKDSTLVFALDTQFSHYFFSQDQTSTWKFASLTSELIGTLFFNASSTGDERNASILKQHLSSIKLDTKIKLNEEAHFKLLMIYSPISTPFYPHYYFDEFYVHKNFAINQFYVELGEKWIPFGVYKNNLIYKPLTKAVGHTKALSFIMGIDKEIYYGSLSIFRKQIRAPSTFNNIGMNFDVGLKNIFAMTSKIGLSYLTSLSDSQFFLYKDSTGEFYGKKMTNNVPGIAIYANLDYKNLKFYYSYIRAMRDFNQDSLSFDNKNALPVIMSIQTGYKYDTKLLPLEILFFYERTHQLSALKLAQQRRGVGLNTYIGKYLTVQFQYFEDKAYRNHIDHTVNKEIVKIGNNKLTNTIALQFVFRFL